jgi:hypothetical protein
VSKSWNYAGRIDIYSAPAALLQHIEWGLNQYLGGANEPNWVNQPLAPGFKACAVEYQSNTPLAAKLVTALIKWRYLRFEITEQFNKTGDATLYRITPDLGLHQASLASNGDVVLNEHQVNQIINNAPSHKKLQVDLEKALGNQWESELEPFRLALASGSSEILSNIG